MARASYSENSYKILDYGYLINLFYFSIKMNKIITIWEKQIRN